MRILYLTETMGWSGGAQQTLLMAQGLRAKGHDLTVVCQPDSEMAERARQAGLRLDFVRMRQDYDVPAAVAVARIVSARRSEILHAQHPTAHAVGLLAVAWNRRPAFAVTRRVTFPLKKNFFSRLKYLSKRIDGYVAVSAAVQEELVRGGVARSRIELIASVADDRARPRSEGAALRQELGLTPDPLILNVGNYADFKGQDILLEAAVQVCRQHPKAQFLFAGRDTEKMQPNVARLGLGRSVRLAGFRTDVPRLLAAADLFVMPSLQEAAGTALREAGFAALPCVGTRVGGIPEMIEEGRTGLLVPPGDAGALAAAILRLLHDREEGVRLGQAARAFCRERFSLAAAVPKMEAFYKRIGRAAALRS